jgi:cation:H+ antiporter
METLLRDVAATQSVGSLLISIAFLLFILGTGADMMVSSAVGLSRQWGIPEGVIGATIVSLGTTFPECAVSVAAAIQGEPDIALGNAVGSIICDTGLILGLANCISPLPLERHVVGRQGWIQLGAGVLLVLACFPFATPAGAFRSGGHLPQSMGFVFLFLLALYVGYSIRWARQERPADAVAAPVGHVSTSRTLMRLACGAAMVVVSSKLLIVVVRETALRLSIPESLIGATLVAFGTSLPELVTAVTAVRKGHGALAVGNVIGADILNVLFVAGAAAAVTPNGIAASAHFFRLLFPAMMIVLVVFRVGVLTSPKRLRRPFGIILLAVYTAVTVITYRHLPLH